MAVKRRRGQGPVEGFSTGPEFGELCPVLLHHLAMEVEVEALDLDFLADSQADRCIDHLEDHEGDDRAPDDSAEDVVDLEDHLPEITVDQPAVGERIDGIRGEGTGEECSKCAANTMDAPGIERVVIAKYLLHMNG